MHMKQKVDAMHCSAHYQGRPRICASVERVLPGLLDHYSMRLWKVVYQMLKTTIARRQKYCFVDFKSNVNGVVCMHVMRKRKVMQWRRSTVLLTTNA